MRTPRAERPIRPRACGPSAGGPPPGPPPPPAAAVGGGAGGRSGFGESGSAGGAAGAGGGAGGVDAGQGRRGLGPLSACALWWRVGSGWGPRQRCARLERDWGSGVRIRAFGAGSVWAAESFRVPIDPPNRGPRVLSAPPSPAAGGGRLGEQGDRGVGLDRRRRRRNLLDRIGGRRATGQRPHRESN